MLVALDQINESISRYESWKSPSIISKSPFEVIEKAIIDLESNEGDGVRASDSNTLNRIKMLESVSPEPVDFAHERSVGINDSVYSNFSDLINFAKRKIGRIVVKEGNTNLYCATGFMVSERLMLTNWHVFKAIEKVRDSEIQFFYEYDIFGRPKQPIIFKLSTKDFFYSFERLDYCFVAVSAIDVTGKIPLSSISYHYLDPMLGKLGIEGIELLNIIHHPGGDYQQLSIRENKFEKILADTIWYKTDTAQGSSGSPVFNDQWQVVALHHSGVPSKSEDGKNYLDKNGNVIVPVDNKIDESKVHWIANEGIRVSVILNDVFSKFPENDLVAGLKKTPDEHSSHDAKISTSNNVKSFNRNTQPQENNKMENNSSNNNTSNCVQISFPAALIETNGNISININNKPQVRENLLKEENKPTTALLTEDLLEVKKIDLENSIDYSDCRGYIEIFLGVEIPLPKPKKELLKYVAKLKNSNKSILDYYHFSTIHHSVRKMPIISAINVDGNAHLRKDMTKREDVWLRDNRLDYDMQLNDKFYKNSGFDRGHMSRREDANWGPTAELAKIYADLTCVYTNACPQVPTLNRSRSGGLWGKLENLILEKGVNREKGKSSKITVFNGPIFSKDDRYYNGIQIPMQFWKIILWFNEAGKLKATAFKLTQEDLVQNIDFEKLDYDNIAEFEEHECSIKWLESVTNIDFSLIVGYDTFKSEDFNESFKINSETEFVNFVDEISKAE